MYQVLWLAVVWLVWATSVQAGTKTWNSGTGGDWWTDSNWTPSGAPQAGDDVVITNAAVVVTLSNAAPATGSFSSLTITNTAKLTFTNWTTSLSALNINVMGSSVVNCNGPFTNAPAMSNRVWLICSNLTVAPSASIDVSGLGYSAGVLVGAVGRSGNGPGGGVLGGSFDPGGGGYGGAGGPGSYDDCYGGSSYGAASDAGNPGSGGGTWDTDTLGHGGGAIWITASGTVTINGKICANGKSSGPNGGASGRSSAGSGGGIHIDSYMIAGTGTVSALGGVATAYKGGGGGGGRIAVTYNQPAQSNNTLNITFSVLAGNNNNTPALGDYLLPGSGELGTLYFPDLSLLNPAGVLCSGKLVVPNITSWSVNSLTISNSWLQFTQEGFQLNVSNNLLIVGSQGRLSMAGSILYTGLPYNNGERLAEEYYYSRLTNVCALYVGGNLILTNGGSLAVFSAATNGTAIDYGALVSVTNDIYREWLMDLSGFTLDKWWLSQVCHA